MWKRYGIVLGVMALSAGSWGQAASTAGIPGQTAKGTTVIGCLSGPDGANRYTLTSMQHRTGVAVVGGVELSKSSGAKVKLTGAWEALPGSTMGASDATRQFHATEVVVMAETCSAPAAVTPQSKKKQQQQQPSTQKK